MVHFDKKEIRETVFLGGNEITPLQIATDRKTGITYARQTVFNLSIRSPWIKLSRYIDVESYDMLRVGSIVKKQDNRNIELHLRDLEGNEYSYNGNFNQKLQLESLREENNIKTQLIEKMRGFIQESSDYELRKRVQREVSHLKNLIVNPFQPKKDDRK